MDLSQRTESFAVDDTSWLGSRHGVNNTQSVTLKTSAFTPSIHYPKGFFKSGIALGKITGTELYGPYAGTTDEVQTITEGGSGLTSFTLTWNGQTTGSIAAAATAATVQAALEALSNIGVGDVLVTGSNGGPYTVQFRGALADTNVAAMTATPTGGSGTVTIATPTAGGADGAADGTETLAGFLMFGIKAPASTDINVSGAMLYHGAVVNSALPVPVDANGRSDAAGRFFFV